VQILRTTFLYAPPSLSILVWYIIRPENQINFLSLLRKDSFDSILLEMLSDPRPRQQGAFRVPSATVPASATRFPHFFPLPTLPRSSNLLSLTAMTFPRRRTPFVSSIGQKVLPLSSLRSGFSLDSFPLFLSQFLGSQSCEGAGKKFLCDFPLARECCVLLSLAVHLSFPKSPFCWPSNDCSLIFIVAKIRSLFPPQPLSHCPDPPANPSRLPRWSLLPPAP